MTSEEAVKYGMIDEILVRERQKNNQWQIKSEWINALFADVKKRK
jgi:hypothetical protein